MSDYGSKKDVGNILKILKEHKISVTQMMKKLIRQFYTPQIISEEVRQIVS